MSSKNLTTLSTRVLAKFVGLQGPIRGRIAPPENPEQEKIILDKILEGDIWVTPTGARVFEFLDENDTTCFAITATFSDDSLADIYQFSSTCINTIEPCGAVFLFLCDVLKLKPIATLTPELIDENIEAPANDDGVYLSVIKEHLEPITVFTVKSVSSLLADSSPKYIANYICTFSEKIVTSNKISDDAMIIIRGIFAKEKNWLFDENLFFAMNTPILKHAFLEVYRTLEFVFVLPRVISLANIFSEHGSTIKINKIDFARLCNKELGWKRIERDSLEKIFTEFYSQSESSFTQAISHCSPLTSIALPSPNLTPEEKKKIDERLLSKFTEKYYKLRNQVVHQFWPDESHPCTDDDWRYLITFTLECINYIYNKHLSK